MIKKNDFFVILIGRPNVGKSTIFNKILGKTSALSSKIAGTTLDLNIKDISYGEADFLISDSGGFNISPATEIERKIKEKVLEYSKKAGVVLFVVDYKSGFVPEDKEIYLNLIKNEANIILIINKVDSLKDVGNALAEFSNLGIKESITISAERGIGIDEVLEGVAKEINLKRPVKPIKNYERDAFKIAIIGRPNSGKSTYINSVLTEDLLFVDEKPHTTRDSIDTCIKYKGYSITLIDTAGIRKKSRLDVNPAAFQEQSMSQIKRADVTIVFIDVNGDITRDDLSLLKRVVLEKKTLMIAFTKWDLKDKSGGVAELRKDILFELKEFSGIPFIFISSKVNKNLYKLLDLSIEINNTKKMKIRTKDFNGFIEEAKTDSKNSRIYKHINYGVQREGEDIPTFLLFTGNKGKTFGMADIKFLRNSIKEKFKIKSNVEVIIEYKKYTT
ncbi:ribosome biogenesis GTPase Der [Candidatus Acidulodesulfobacterium sp. H_13]|uniref:ribosome biogenesis GTPase Der n=1 Tax=Candidatus Acidulodesulfobacterium sp. H_13 TaxID=3395470 RepID=UPI003AF4EF48